MKQPAKYALALLVSMSALLSPPDVQADNDLFLTIDGIKGVSTAEDHKDAIALTSFAWSLSVTGGSGTGSGGSTAKASFSDLIWTQEVDRAVPTLMQAAAAQKHFTKATLDLVRPGGDRPFTYLTMTFEDVLITGLSLSGDRQSTGVEASLSYGKLEMKVNVMNDKGQVEDYIGSWSLNDGKLAFAGSDVVYLQMANLNEPLDADQLPAIPEPRTWALLLAGLALTGGAAYRRLAQPRAARRDAD
jgi:type VI secretion system secreted protein Hcp